jgi:hypothetical protein
MFESLNTNTGQCFSCSIIDNQKSGLAYLYGISTPSDQPNPPSLYQVFAAIGPAPAETIILANEDGMQQVAVDNFTSGLGNLSPNWTTVPGKTKLQIAAGPYLEASAASPANCVMYYNGAQLSNDQYSEFTIHSLVGNVNNFLFTFVRLNPATYQGYFFQFNNNSIGSFASLSIYVLTSIATQIGPAVVCVPQVGDVFRLAVIGNVLSIYQNGFLIVQVQDYANTFTSGVPAMGMAVNTVTDVQVSRWAGGNVGVIPNYSALGQSGSLRQPFKEQFAF